MSDFNLNGGECGNTFPELIFSKFQERMKLPSAFLAPDVIMNYIVSGDPDVEKILDSAIKGEFRLMTSDFALYEAVASLNPEELDHKRIVKLLRGLEIVASPKINMTHPRKLKLRRNISCKTDS